MKKKEIQTLSELVAQHFGFSVGEAQKLLSNSVSREVIFKNLHSKISEWEYREKYLIDLTIEELRAVNYAVALRMTRDLPDEPFYVLASVQSKLNNAVE